MKERKKHHGIVNSIYLILFLAAIIILCIAYIFPFVRVSGNGMSPSFEEGDILILNRVKEGKYGDVCAFKWDNKILLRRIIAKPGDIVSIDFNGRVKVNGVMLEENYVTQYDIGKCNISFPYDVPSNTYFVLGDNRVSVLDSRNKKIGCINKNDLIGIVNFRIWPFKKIKILNLD